MPDPGVTVVIPLPAGQPTANVEAAVRAWLATLSRIGRDFELLVIAEPDAGSPLAALSRPRNEDGREALLTKLAALPGVAVVPHEGPSGFGACLRTGLARGRFDLWFYTALDYPYSPADFPPFLERIALVDERIGVPSNLVAGCRTGRPVPAFWRGVGTAYRLFLRVALGMPTAPIPGWLGLGEHLRAWRAWLVFGVPLHDPNCAFKLFRKAVFDKFPIQSDGGFVHAELVAKCTFVTSVIDEVPLAPSAAPIPAVEWRESGRLFRDPVFTSPVPLTQS